MSCVPSSISAAIAVKGSLAVSAGFLGRSTSGLNTCLAVQMMLHPTMARGHVNRWNHSRSPQTWVGSVGAEGLAPATAPLLPSGSTVNGSPTCQATQSSGADSEEQFDAHRKVTSYVNVSAMI